MSTRPLVGFQKGNHESQNEVIRSEHKLEIISAELRRRGPCTLILMLRPTALRRSAGTWRSNHCWLYNDVAPAFFLAAQRAFASADNFFRAAGLIGFRAAAFLAGAAAFVGADLPFRFAHARFIASPMRLRASALIVRLCGADCGDCALGGRPRRGRDEEYDPSRATIA